MPSDDYLKNLGFNIMDFRNRSDSQGGRSARKTLLTYKRNGISVPWTLLTVMQEPQGPAPPDGPPFTDEQAEVREGEDDAAKAAGEAYFDEKLGIMRPGTDPEIQRLLNEQENKSQVRRTCQT